MACDDVYQLSLCFWVDSASNRDWIIQSSFTGDHDKTNMYELSTLRHAVLVMITHIHYCVARFKALPYFILIVIYLIQTVNKMMTVILMMICNDINL